MTAIPDGSVVITPAQMFAQIGELTNEVRAMRAVVDPAISEVRADIVELRKDVDDLTISKTETNTRVTVIETKLLAAWAAIALLVGALGVLASFLTH